MFATSDKSSSTRVFQKPNILRRKPRVQEPPPTPVIPPAPEVPHKKSKGSGSWKHRCSKPYHSIRKPVQRIRLDSYICEEYRMRKLLGGAEAATKHPPPPQPAPAAPIFVGHTQIAADKVYEEANVSCASHQVAEKYAVNQKYELSTDINEETNSPTLVASAEESSAGFMRKLAPYLNFRNAKQRRTTSDRKEATLSNERVNADAMIKIETEDPEQLPDHTMPTTSIFHKDPLQKSEETLSQVYKCKWESCSVTLASAEALNVHANTHSSIAEDTAAKPPKPAPIRQVLLNCPARQRGERNMCEQIFHCREDLARHIKEEHTEEDAAHCCETCGRSFFWYSGLRAHTRVHDDSARAVYACVWPGCSRVFAQACRLKEHRRSHTGDKPYPCLYPSCGWAFRTASKLLRHARRHTGERRFTCRVCGGAFLRAEHLREHETRHTPRLHRHQHACRVPGCEQKFTNKSSLYMHTKRVHPPPLPSPPPLLSLPAADIKLNLSEGFMERLTLPVEAAECKTFRSARTHVTWPLTPGEHKNTPASDEEAESEDWVSDSGGRVAGVYTVRSDLFLHGNAALHQDDSQPCMEAGMEAGMELVLLPGSGRGEARRGGYADLGSHLDTDLSLLDSTADPINHLLQEELMLTDSTADESPFQVLLLSGNSVI